MDIDFGKIKAKFGALAQVTMGLSQLISLLVKIIQSSVGIGHPKEKQKVNKHVLEDFKEDEEEKIKEITDNIVKLVPTLIEKIDLFSSKVNQNLNGI